MLMGGQPGVKPSPTKFGIGKKRERILLWETMAIAAIYIYVGGMTVDTFIPERESTRKNV